MGHVESVTWAAYCSLMCKYLHIFTHFYTTLMPLAPDTAGTVESGGADLGGGSAACREDGSLDAGGL